MGDNDKPKNPEDGLTETVNSLANLSRVYLFPVRDPEGEEERILEGLGNYLAMGVLSYGEKYQPNQTSAEAEETAAAIIQTVINSKRDVVIRATLAQYVYLNVPGGSPLQETMGHYLREWGAKTPDVPVSGNKEQEEPPEPPAPKEP